jgi:hypothetical protein
MQDYTILHNTTQYIRDRPNPQPTWHRIQVPPETSSSVPNIRHIVLSVFLEP